jgi:predicted metal-binding membrane protein
VWQVTAWKRRAPRSCQRIVPLPPRGWRATAGCLRFGAVAAARCVGSCWPLMLVMAAVAESHLAWMAFLGAIPLSERYVVAFRRAPWLVSLALAALAAAIAGGAPGAPDNGFRCPIPAV